MALTLLFLAGPVAVPRAAQAANSTVTTCTYGSATTPGTFAYAVAQAQGGGGAVRFACSGTITFPADGQITIAGGPVTIDGLGQNVTLSGGDATRLFTVSSGGNLTLRQLTVTGGRASDVAGIGLAGGAILNNGGSLTAVYTTFTSNTAIGAGGTIASTGTLSISNSTFTSNTATGVGGAIALNLSSSVVGSSALTVSNSTFGQNTATGAGGAVSAAGTVSDSSPLTVSNSTFNRNNSTAAQGGLSSTPSTRARWR